MGVLVSVGVPVGDTEAAFVGVGVDNSSTVAVDVGVAAGDATLVEGVDAAGRGGVVGDAVGKVMAGTVCVSSWRSPKTTTPAAMQAAATRITLAIPRAVGSQRRFLLG